MDELDQEELRCLTRHWVKQADDFRGVYNFLSRDFEINPKAAKIHLLTLRDRIDKALSYCDRLEETQCPGK